VLLESVVRECCSRVLLEAKGARHGARQSRQARSVRLDNADRQQRQSTGGVSTHLSQATHWQHGCVSVNTPLTSNSPAAKTKYSCLVIFSPILPTSTPVSHLHPTRATTHKHTHMTRLRGRDSRAGAAPCKPVPPACEGGGGGGTRARGEM
jgi:hypothetical protein